MKKLTITTILLLSFILAACSGPTANISEQALDLIQSAANTAASGVEVAAAQAQAPVAQVQSTPAPSLPSSDISELLAAYEGALTSVYEYVNPSVVNIDVLQEGVGMGGGLPGQESPFEMPGMPQGPDGAPLPDMPQYNSGSGSGFVWDKEGHIVTNHHVVGEADEIKVTFYNGYSVPAELIGSDPDSDLAVLKVDVPTDQLRPVQLADSQAVKVGQLAIAIGNPFGLEGTMTVGIISAVGRTMPAGSGMVVGPVYSIPDVIQTDAPINPGNSGGVLVDDLGQVVGVTFAIESPSRANAGIGFVIPSAIVSRVVPVLIKDGNFQHPYLGISGVSLNLDLAEAMDLDSDQRGALIGEVSPDGPADKAGLRGSDQQAEIAGQQISVGGDVIIAVNGETIQGMDDLIAYLSNSTSVGDQITVSVLRDGKQVDVKVTLEARPNLTQAYTEIPQGPQGPQAQAGKAYLGINGSTLTSDTAESIGLPADQEGVFVQQVGPITPAGQAGLKNGDVIIAIDNQDISSIEGLVTELGEYEPGDEVTLTILRDGEQEELEVTLSGRP